MIFASLLTKFFIIAQATASFWCPVDGRIDTTVHGEGKYGTMTAVHKELKRCANSIHTLSLRVALIGCSGWPDRWSLPFNPHGGDRYPNLTSLRLEGYQFDDREYETLKRDPIGDGVWRRIHLAKLWLTLTSIRRNMTNLELWLDAMDWSELQNLELVDGMNEQLVGLVAPRLDKLKTLSISSPWHENGATLAGRFVASLPLTSGLSILKWENGWNETSLMNIGKRFGESITQLSLHTPDPWNKFENVAVSSSQARLISKSFPNLHYLSISLDRNGSWPYEALRAIAGSFGRLQELDLWLELPSDAFRDLEEGRMTHSRIQNDDGFRLPRLNRDSALEVFDFLAENKVGEPFKRIKFFIGDWGRPWDGPLYVPDWIEGRRGLVNCTVDVAGTRICEHSVNQERSLYEAYSAWDL